MISLNQNANVVTEDFTKNLVDHTRVGFAPNGISELSFEHRKGSFDVAPFMVVAKERLSVKHVIVIHLLPDERCVLGYAIVILEGDVRRSSESVNLFEIVIGDISLICGNLFDGEILSGLLNKWSEIRGVMRRPSADLGSRNYVSGNTAGQVNFNPLTIIEISPVLLVEPLDEARGAGQGYEAGADLAQ